MAVAATAIAFCAVNASAIAQTAPQTPTQTAPQVPPGERFLKLGEAERYWWYEGAIRTLSVWVSSFDRQKGECIAQWFIRDRERKTVLIENAIRESPQYGEAVTLVGLLIPACGDITPPRAR